MALTTPTPIRTEPLTRSTTLGSALSDIRMWLDSEKIEPTDFKTIVSRRGLGFEIIFKSETRSGSDDSSPRCSDRERGRVGAPYSVVSLDTYSDTVRRVLRPPLSRLRGVWRLPWRWVGFLLVASGRTLRRAR
jgi:hypothetical protein